MDGILIIAVTALVLLVFIVWPRLNNDTIKFNTRNRCSGPHSWIYKDDNNGGEFMICKDCDKLPGVEDEL